MFPASDWPYFKPPTLKYFFPIKGIKTPEFSAPVVINFFLRISANGSRISERVRSVGQVTKNRAHRIKQWYDWLYSRSHSRWSVWCTVNCARVHYTHTHRFLIWLPSYYYFQSKNNARVAVCRGCIRVGPSHFFLSFLSFFWAWEKRSPFSRQRQKLTRPTPVYTHTRAKPVPVNFFVWFQSMF